jgi:hypothetical protein
MPVPISLALADRSGVVLDPSERVSFKTCAGLLVVLLALNLTILGIRVHSLIERGSLTATTGTEGSVVYSVWKARHNYPLYEAPGLIFTHTLYNFLYYETTASVAKVLNVDADELLLSTRLTTAAFALIGFFAGLMTVARFRLFSDRSHLVLAASAIALFWFGTVPVGWWAWSARPDIGAVCLASFGLLCFLIFLDSGSIWILLLSSFFFFLAWAFKQSIIWTFAGTVLVTLACRRKLKYLAALIGPLALCALGALYLGGADYRFNILTIPSMGFFDAANGVKAIVKNILENPLLFLTPILALAVLMFTKTTAKEPPEPAASSRFRLTVLSSIYLCTLAGGSFLCFRAGSDINYFFEAGMVAAIAALPSAILLFSWSKRASGWFFSLASLMLAGVCLIQLAIYFLPESRENIPSSLAFLRGKDFGRLRLLTQQQEQEQRLLAGLVAAAPKPVLVIDDIISQPWHSTDGRYPAFSIDPIILLNMRLRGVMKDDRIATLIQLHRFSTVVVSVPDHISIARQSGYDFVASLQDGSEVLSLRTPSVPLSNPTVLSDRQDR